MEIKAEEFENNLQADQAAGPSTTHRGVDQSEPPPVDWYSVPSYHWRPSSPSTPTTYTTIRRSLSEYPQSIERLPGWQPRRTPTPYPKRPNQRLSHIEVTNLEEVLADPEWAAVRAAYLLSQRLRKGAFKRPPPREGKGKERAVSYAETSDESEEEVVNYVLGGNSSSSRGWTGRSRSSSARSRSPRFTSQPPKYHKPRKGSRYSFLERFGEMGTELGMEDLEDDDLYVPTDGEDRGKSGKGRKGNRPQERRFVPETIEEISAGGGWPDEPGAARRHLSVAMESVEGRAPSPEVTAPPSKLHTTLVRRGSQSAEYIPIKRPRKRKRRYNTSESEEKLVDDDLSSASEWADDSGSAAKPEGGEVPLDSSLAVSRNGKRIHSIWTARGTQRNMRIFTEEEQLRIEAECTKRWCHMCHKKKLTMACNASKGRCATAFCDHCLARCVELARHGCAFPLTKHCLCVSGIHWTSTLSRLSHVQGVRILVSAENACKIGPNEWPSLRQEVPNPDEERHRGLNSAKPNVQSKPDYLKPPTTCPLMRNCRTRAVRMYQWPRSSPEPKRLAEGPHRLYHHLLPLLLHPNHRIKSSVLHRYAGLRHSRIVPLRPIFGPAVSAKTPLLQHRSHRRTPPPGPTITLPSVRRDLHPRQPGRPLHPLALPLTLKNNYNWWKRSTRWRS